MANKDDYLTEYQQFFENFAQTVNPKDQLPVKLASYKLVNVEVVGGIIDWTSQYLMQKKCPPPLLPTLIKIIIDETRKLCKKQPLACGFNPTDNAYEPLKLMQTVITITCEVCLRYLDNSKLCSLPSPGPPHNAVSVFAIKNGRRRMEDRHVVVHDLSSLFVEQESTPSSYYAIFDGHAGHDAAAYSCAHLHQFLAESKDFISNPEQALREAFLKTDALFLDKCKVENLSSGTTAVCALIHHKEKLLYVAWVGDSQAILVRQGHFIQCVHPHKPSREDEKRRVEQDGGCVLFWDTWRVNGQLAVSRAIGDSEYKPYVTAVPDIVEISLNGTEDFLILACDGLWDCVTESLAAQTVYSTILENQDDIEFISQRLVQLAKQSGSADNITVIVVLLREASKIAAEAAHWANSESLIMDTLDNANANPFTINSNADIILHKEALLLDIAKQNGDTTPNGKRPADEEFDEDDDLGPETDVDAIDDVLMCPDTNNHFENNKDEEKATLETEHIKHDPVKPESREETSTPPADSVLDTSGLLDNVTESCEDSDDEWNYYKGDITDKENVPPSDTDKEVCDIIDNDEMSHLNPNAAEFVPLSPKGGTDSPVLQSFINEPLIAQSPKKPTNTFTDIKAPNLQEFESEIKSRPSEVFNETNEGTHQLTSEEIMVNLLNGKNADEIEFHPVSTPIKTFKADEFHFGPNATPFTTPAKFDTSDAVSTRAVFGDESSASYIEKAFDSSYAGSEFSQSVTKEQDPMSTSFYLDRDDDNPFDLNEVQVLPENIDEFLSNTKDFLNETISDLPEHNPLVQDVKDQHIQNQLIDILQEHIKPPVTQEFEHIPVKEDNPPVVAESPVPSQDTLDVDHQAEVNSCPIPQQSPVVLQSPTPPQSPRPVLSPTPPQSPLLNVAPSHLPLLSQSPTPPQSPSHTQCPISSFSPVPPQSPIVANSPTPAQSPISAESPIPSQFTTHLESHLSDVLACTKADPVYQQISDPIIPVLSEATVRSTPDLIPISHSPVPSQDTESPVEDVTSSVKDLPLLSSSPLAEDNNLDVIQHVVDLVHDTSLPLEEASPLSHSKCETESVATTDVNSFLERSLLPDVESPLSANEQDTIIAASVLEPEVQLPLQDVVIKAEVIAPEFPVQQEIITTPVDAVAKTVGQKKPSTPATPKTRLSGTSTASSAKKPTPKAATAPTKPAVKLPAKATPPVAAKTALAKATQARTSTTPVSSPKLAQLKTATTPVSSPKPAASKPATKTPLTNGVAKSPAAATLSKTTAAKPALSKTARPASAPTAKPLTKPAAPATARPTTLLNKTSSVTTTTVKKTTVSSTVTNNKSTSKVSATLPKEPTKPRPSTAPSAATAPARPKPTTTKTITKTPDMEKSIKEAANKQTASRTAAAAKPLKKVEPKVATTTRTAVTKTTATKVDAKKPQELVRHPLTKTKITKTTAKETKVHENGIDTEIITVTSTTTIEEPQLIIKDVSPVIENSQLLD